MRAADARAIAAGTPGLVLMERAGAAVAEAARAMLAPGMGATVLCGPGNNGGDGYVAARLLAAAGIPVVVAADRPPAGGDAALAAAGWTGAVSSWADAPLGPGRLVVDALFGTGLARPLDGAVARLVARAAASGAPVLAVDLPSGIDADTGAVLGVALRADRTVTFACLRPGHCLNPGRLYCGPVGVADIGLESEIVAAGETPAVNEPALWRDALPRIRQDGHKYDRGHALVVSGGPAHTGAARLAARGAFRVGAGLVSLVTSARALSVNAAHLTAIMLKVCDDPDEFSDLLTDDRFNALALGPGLGIGEGTRDWVRAALEADRATVLDADALTSFSGQVGGLREMMEAGREGPVVATPHEGEFRRLLAGRDEPDDAARAIPAIASRLDRTIAAARHLGLVVVLKGAETVVAAPDGRAAVNTHGTPYLATAGSGDVLTGLIAGLLAQGMPGFEAACAGVWMHGDAGRRHGPGLIAEDLPEAMPAVWRGLV